MPNALSIRPGYWRVTTPDGRVLGNIEAVGADGVPEYRANRFRPAVLGYAPLGSFSDLAIAIDAFRN
ncbi:MULTISPECIES: hypothetical protein [Plantibacter]|uniref:hypothetical protein n=1 Tax=Plantibacter TaxID=190323 RepID=UPI00177B6AF5|nr:MULTISPECIES: hypothetical protein [Plantibacter]MBD8466625.1 hypothetical protein [Plantibacter sp. CFBP 8798]CAH0124587.1 hypothetical protein SRABI02_00085 [Plantibacter cousiniae]